MRLIEKVPVREVKEKYLLACAFKEIAERHKELGPSELKESYEKLRQEFAELDEDGLSRLIPDKTRLRRYDYMDWHWDEKELSDMGVWPKMQDLDLELTIGSVIDTAEAIMAVRQGKSSFNIPSQFTDKINSIRELSEFTYDRFPLILFPGGEVRGKKNKHARKNRKPLCSILTHDIDDGCSRAVAYALKGLDKAPVYFGRYRK